MSAKTTRNGSLWFFWIPIGISAFIFLSIILLGNVLTIGARLGALHPFAERGFYILIVVVLVWLLALPLAQVMVSPVLALEKIETGTGDIPHKALRKIAKQLLRSRALLPEQHGKLAGAVALGSDLRQPLAEAIRLQSEAARALIRAHAVLVFVSTAISQNGRLDAVTVLTANFRLVRQLVGHFGYRPPFPVLVKLYIQVFLAAFIADEVSDLDIESLTHELGLGVLTAVPGTRLVANSLLDGTINALLTLRVGFVTRKCLLNAGGSLTRKELRKNAIREARQEFGAVFKEGCSLLPGAVKQVYQTALGTSTATESHRDTKAPI